MKAPHCAERIFAVNMPGEGNESWSNIPLGQDVRLSKAMKRVDSRQLLLHLAKCGLPHKAGHALNTLLLNEIERWETITRRKCSEEQPRVQNCSLTIGFCNEVA